jgi:hypothetical protein
MNTKKKMEAEVKANIEYDKENKITFLKMEKEIVGVGFGYSV